MNQAFTTRRLAGLFAGILAMGVLLAEASVYAQEAASTQPTVPATQAAASQRAVVVETAWADLQLLRDYVHASRQRDPQRRAADLTKARKDLVAASFLTNGVTPEEVETFVTLWPATVAHYVDGFKRDRMIVRSNDREADVTIEVVNPEDQKVADEASSRIHETLEKQGLSGQDLQARQQVLLKRELAERGIGYPLAAIIQIRLQNVDGTWKVRNVKIASVAGGPSSPPVVRPVVVGPKTQPAR